MQHRKLYHEINFHIRCQLEAPPPKKRITKKSYVGFMLTEESYKENFNLNYNSVPRPLIYLLCVLWFWYIREG